MYIIRRLHFTCTKLPQLPLTRVNLFYMLSVLIWRYVKIVLVLVFWLSGKTDLPLQKSCFTHLTISWFHFYTTFFFLMHQSTTWEIPLAWSSFLSQISYAWQININLHMHVYMHASLYMIAIKICIMECIQFVNVGLSSLGLQRRCASLYTHRYWRIILAYFAD